MTSLSRPGKLTPYRFLQSICTSHIFSKSRKNLKVLAPPELIQQSFYHSIRIGQLIGVLHCFLGIGRSNSQMKTGYSMAYLMSEASTFLM